MGSLSTHVLDTSVGRPATGIDVVLSSGEDGDLGSGTTDEDGRIDRIGPDRLDPGRYALRFDIAPYFEARARECFYPEIVVAFRVTEHDDHLHVPVLLNPFGYATYRGS